MKNLEQIRARNALAFASSNDPVVNSSGGEVVKKLPALIMGHGLLAAGAFAYQKQHDDRRKGRNNGFYLCFNAIARHLSDPEIHIVRISGKPSQQFTLEDLLEYLTNAQSHSGLLKSATSEALAWLSYARRFVKKPTTQNQSEFEDE
ncbi:MAG: type III-B CRISPR module-associated protein Cmr5 [Lentisphaerota bacterium]